MSFVGLQTFFTSIVAAQTIEPSTVGFWGNLFSIVGVLFMSLWQAICALFYTVCMWFLSIVDFLQYFIQKLIGLDYWLREGSKTFRGAIESDLLFSFLYNETVQNVFRAMIGVFFLLLIVFTIFAIIKQEWTFATGGFEGGDGNSKVKILRNSMKAIALVLVFPLILVIGIISSNAILASLVNALSIDMKQTFGSTLFSIASQSANKYRVYADDESRSPVTQEVSFYVDTSGNTIAYSDGSVSGGKYTTYISNHKQYLETINSSSCTKYTVNTIFELVNPKHESSFSGYCISMPVNGKNTYYMVKCASKNKTAMYYYLRNQLEVNVMTKNGSAAGNKAMAADGNTYRNIYANLKNRFESTGNQAFIRSIDLTDYGDDTSLIQACYNTWGYSSVYKNRQDFSVTADYNVVGSSVLADYGINGLSSAKVLFNSGEISSYFDGGQFGVVQKQSEYRVMADVIDFMNEYGVKLYMIDATSSMVKWNMTDYTAMGSRWVTDRINSSTGVSEGVTYAGEKVLPFIVSYSDICIDIESGNVLYTPKFNRNSELDGTVYIMCWKYTEGTTAKYVPLLNGVRYTDPYSKDTYTFKSDYLAGSYNGVIVAKGTFETNSTNSNLGEPTYIRTTATTGNATIDEALANSDEMYYYKMENRGYMKPYFVDNGSSTEQYTNITGVELSSDFEGITVNNQNVGSEVVWKAVQSVKQADGTSKVIEKSFNPAMIQSITVRLRESRYTYANYAGLTFSSSDGETYYLFCTADKNSYFVISPDKVHGYIRIMGLESNGSVIESGVGGHLKTLKHSYKFEYYYNIDSVSGTESSTGVNITPNYFTYAKTENGKSLFQTVDMQYITIKNGSNIIYQEGMYVNASFNTTATNLITFDQNSKLVKFATPEPSSSDNTYQLAFYKFNLYNYYVGVTGSNTSLSYHSYDIGSKTVNPHSGDPGMTFEFRIGVNDFSWDKKSDSLGLYDGKMYVGTIYKAIDQEIANTDIDAIFSSLHNNTVSVLYDGKTYYNIITQNKFANTGEMATHYNNIRDSLIVGFYRDNAGGIVGSSNWLSTQGIESDINIALFGGWRWKMSMMPQKMTNADMAGYFTLEDGVGFDYFFERSSLDEDNNEGVGFDTFFMPSKVSYWLILIASALIIKILGTSLWGVIKRFYQITLYFVAMPAVASTIVFDDGERFKTTIQTPLITQVLSTYGVILGINMFFVLLAPVRSMSNIFTEADMQASGNLFLKYLPIGPKLLNNFVYILFMLVAFTMIDALPKAISQILSPGGKDNNIAESGKNTMEDVGKAMKGAGDMISGRSAMKAASKVAGVAGDLFRPAHALVGGVANKAKGFLKGGGGKGEDDGSGREEGEGEGENAADETVEATTAPSTPPPDTTAENAGGGAGGSVEEKDSDDSDAADATLEAQNAIDPMEDTSDINMSGEVSNAADETMEAPVDGNAREDDADAMDDDKDVPLSEKLKQVRDEHEDGEYEQEMTEQGAEFKASAEEFGDEANETITEGGKALNESITEGGKAAGDAMGQTGDELMQSGQEMIGDGVLGTIAGGAMVAAGAVTKGAGTVVEKGSDLAGTAVEKGADVVGDVVEKGADVVGAVGEKGMVAAGKVADKAIEIAPEIAEKVEKAGGQLKTAVVGDEKTGKRGLFGGGRRRARRGDPQGANAAAFGQLTPTENAIMNAHTAKKHPIRNFGKKHPKLKKAAKVAGLLGAAAVAGAFIPGTTLALMAGGGFLAYKAGKGIGRRVKKTVKGAKQFAKNVGRTFKRAGRAVVTGAMAGAAGLAVTTLSGGNVVAGALVAGAIVSKRRKAKKASNTSRTRFAKKAGGTSFTHAGDGAGYTAPESKPINGTKGVTVANEVVPHDASSGAPKTTGAKVAAVANGDVAPEEVEDAVAVAEYNRQAIDDRDVVDDTVGARANVVKNKVGSKVGRLIAARTLADYGEEDAGEDASMQDKMDIAINGTEVENADGTKGKKEGLLTNSMRLQAIRSTLTGKDVEDFDALSAEDQEKQLSAYKVASSIGLDGKIGFSVTKKGADGTFDENKATVVEQSVSDNIVSQMLSSDKVGDEAINVAIDEINAGSKVDAALAQNLSLGVDYNAQNAGTATSMLSKSVYDKASQDEDIVAEAMLRHIESDKDSDLYSRFQESFGITEATDLNNATDRARVIEQIKMHRKNHVDDNTSIIGSMKEGEYAAELTSVVQEKVQDGSFKVTAWDMASKESRAEFKQKTSANLKAVSDGHSILAGAKKEDQDRIIGNAAVSMMRENGHSATAVKIQNAAFAANITEEDLANISDDQISTMLGEGKTADNLTAKDKQFLGFVKASTNGNFGAVNPQNISKFKKQFTNVGARVDAFERLSDQTISTGVENAGQKNAIAQMATQDPTKAMDAIQTLSLQSNYIAQGNLANPVVAERVGKRYEQYARRNNMSNTDISKANANEIATFLNEDALSSNLVMREMKNDGVDFAAIVNEDYNVMYTRTKDEAATEQQLSLDAVKADSPESLYYAFVNSNVEGKATITGDLFAKYADIESENSAGYKGAMTAIKGKVDTAELATFMNTNGLSNKDIVSAYKKAELLGETEKDGFGVETLKKYTVQSDATDKAVLSAIATKATPEQFGTIAADLANTGLTEEQKGSLYAGVAKRGFDGLSKTKQDALLAQGYTKADLQGLSYYELTQRADGKSSKEIYETVRGKTEHAKNVDQVFEAQGALISTSRVKEAIDAEGGSKEAAAFVADAYAGKVSLLSKDEQDAERRGAALKLIGDDKQEAIKASADGLAAIQKAETHAAYKEYTTNSQYSIALSNVKNSAAYKKAQKAENFDEEAYVVAAMDKETDHGVHFRQGQKRIADVKAAARENAIIDIAVKDDEALAAQVVAHGQDAVELANKRRVAQVMGATSNSDKVTINDMYANAIANNNSLYNKANIAFRSVSGGKDLADVDVMTRNNFLANDFTATLSGRDADWFKEQKRSIDMDYLTKVGGPDIEAKIKRTDIGVIDAKTGQKSKVGVNYGSMGEYLDAVQAQGISIDQALKNDGLLSTVKGDNSVDNMSVEQLNKVIASGMSQEQFDAIYNEAKHDNFGEEVGVFSDVKKDIIGEQLNAGTGLTPAVNYAGMSAQEKQSFNYNKNLIQQSIRGDDNSAVLANAFRNTTLIDNDRHVDAIVAASGKSKVEILKNNSAFVENARMQVINSNTHDSLRNKIENQYRADTGLKVDFKDLKEGERNAIYAQYLANDTFMKKNAVMADKFNKSVDTKISDMSTTATAEDFKKGLSDQDINNYLKTNEPVKDQLVEHVAANMTLGLDDETRKLREGEAVLGDSALTNQVALDMLDTTVSNNGVNKKLLPEFVKTQAKVKQVKEDTSIRRRLGLKANASQDEIEDALNTANVGGSTASEIDKATADMGADSRVTEMVKKDAMLLTSLGLDKNASDYDISKAMFGEYNEKTRKFEGKHKNADVVKHSVALNLYKDDVIKSVKTNKKAVTDLGLDEKATDEQIFEAINTRTNASIARNAISHRLATKKNKTDLERAAVSLESGDGTLGHDYILKNETQLKSALAKDMFFTTDSSGKTVLRENAKYGQATKYGQGRGIADAFDSSISKLKGSSKAFNKGVYNGVTKDIDPNKAGADARADFFRSQTPDLVNQVGFGKSKKKQQQIKGVSEAFDAFVKDVNGTRSERREKGAQAIWYKVTKKLPEQSAAYTNWNRVLEKKITDIKTGGGQYATMSRAAREAEVAKFEAQKIDTKLPANFAQMSSEEQRAYKEKQSLLKHEALTTGNLSALYKTGSEVTAARRPGAIKRFADNAGYSLGMSGKNMSQAVKDQHKQDLTDIDGQIARFNATRAMRNKNVDFGANFNTFVNNYLDNRSANTVIKQSNKQFLQQFKGQTDANGKKLDENFKFADLTKEQQQAVVKIRENSMASHMNRLHQVASKKVAKDAGLDPTTYLEEKGIETETVRYKDGSKKYRHVQSKLHIPGLDRAITAKRVRDIKAYEEEYEKTGGEVSEKTKRRYQKSYYGKRSLESTIQNQNRAIELQKTFDKVNEFNRNFKGNSSEYEAAFKKEFGPLAEQLYSRYNSKLGNQFRANLGKSPVAVQQRAVTNELMNEMKKTSDRMKFGSKYIPATASNGYAYVGKTMTGAKTRMEIELDRTNAADINKAYKQFSTERSALSYDSLFAKLKPSLQESFKAGKKKGFADMSEDQKKEALAKHLERELAKANNRVHNNNFLRSDASDLQRLNGVYVQRSKVNNSGVSRTMLKALTTNESKIYQNVVNNYNSALRKYEEEQKHMGRLGSALKEITSGVQSSGSRAQAKKIREQIETSSVRLSVLKKEYEMAAARKNEFEHRLIETKVKPVAGGAPVGYNSGRVRNIFNEYRFPRKDGKEIEPDSEQGRRIMWAVAYFMRRQRGHMDRIKLDIESMVRRNIIAESSRLNSRMNALIKRQNDNFGSTIRDLLESKKLLESEIKKLEGSTKAGDVQLRTELQIHYSRLDNEYEKLVKELGDVDVAISSVSAIAKKKK